MLLMMVWIFKVFLFIDKTYHIPEFILELKCDYVLF